MVKKTLFSAPTHPAIAKIVTFTSIGSAREASKVLESKFDSATSSMKLVILRSANLASNRAVASSKRKSITVKGKHELIEIGRIYKALAMKLSDKYAELKKSC